MGLLWDGIGILHLHEALNFDEIPFSLESALGANKTSRDEELMEVSDYRLFQGSRDIYTQRHVSKKILHGTTNKNQIYLCACLGKRKTL